MAAPLLLRGLPLLRLRLHIHQYRAAAGIFSTPRRPWCTAAEPSRADESLSSTDKSTPGWSAGDPPKYPRWDDTDYGKWKDKEAEILKDIEPITSLTKEILHSDRGRTWTCTCLGSGRESLVNLVAALSGMIL